MELVKIINDEDGTEIKNAKWCAVNDYGDSPRTLCSGQVFGHGEGSAIYELKKGVRVTCPRCIEILKYFKYYNF